MVARAAALVLAFAACGGASGPAAERFQGVCMGTTWNATVVAPAPLDVAERAAVQEALEEALRSVDESMSTWKADSELSELNRAPAGEARHTSRGLLAVALIAHEVHLASEGAFEPTLGPLVELWGFGPAAAGDVPGAAAIEAALERVGFAEHIAIDKDAGTLTKARADVELDFSAVAKGWAADHAAEVLEARGYRDALVEVGGEVVVRGERAGGGPWRLLVEDPRRGPDDPPRPATRLVLSDAALATSGDYRNWRELRGGESVSHVLDPVTGRPSEGRVASASVIAPDCARADAWATALMVSGERGLAWIEAREGLEALIQLREGDELRRLESSGWAGHAPPADDGR